MSTIFFQIRTKTVNLRQFFFSISFGKARTRLIFETEIVYYCQHVWTNYKAWAYFITPLNRHLLFVLFRDIFKIATFCQGSKHAGWMTIGDNEDCNCILNILEYWICCCLTSWNNSKVVFFFPILPLFGKKWLIYSIFINQYS